MTGRLPVGRELEVKSADPHPSILQVCEALHDLAVGEKRPSSLPTAVVMEIRPMLRKYQVGGPCDTCIGVDASVLQGLAPGVKLSNNALSAFGRGAACC